MPKTQTSPTSKSDVVIVSGDNWEGIYINGVLITEGHDLTAGDALASIGIHYSELGADAEWLNAEGSLPSFLKDVQLA